MSGACRSPSGIGVDIVSLAKIRSLWANYRIRLCEDMFSDRELAPLASGGKVADSLPEQLSASQLRFLGARFAGKEAALKALGMPRVPAFNWCDLEILGSERIEVELHNRLRQYAARAGIRRLVGSTASTDSVSVAVVLRVT